MTGIRLSNHQSKQRSVLDQISNNTDLKLDQILNLINDELTPPLRMRASTTPSYNLHIDSITVKTEDAPEGHGRNKTITPYAGIIPTFTSGYIVFPSTSGGSVGAGTLTLFTPYTVTIPVSHYLKVLVMITSASSVKLTFGISDPVLANATLPEQSGTDTTALGYIVLFNSAGTIGVIDNSSIYFFAANTDEAQRTVKRGGTGQDFSGSTGVVKVSAGVMSAAAVDIGTADITGILPIANGGTGQITATAATNALLPNQSGNAGKALTTDGTNTAWSPVVTDPLTTRGDLLTRNSSNLNDRIAVGAANRILTSNGTDPSWGQISNTSYFTSGAEATPTVHGIVKTYSPNDNTGYKAVAVDLTLTDTDGYHTVRVNSASLRTITLPSAANNVGRIINFKQAGTGGIIIAPTGGESIDGETSSTINRLYKQYATASIVSNGTNWEWLNLQTEHGTYSPTITNVTNTSAHSNGDYWFTRIGRTVTVHGYFTSTITTTNIDTVVTITLPIIGANFDNVADCAGVVTLYSSGVRDAGTVYANSGAQTVTIAVQNTTVPSATAGVEWRFSIAYQML